MIDMNELNKIAENVQKQFGGIDFDSIKKDTDKAMQISFEKALEPINEKLDKILKHLDIE